MTLTALSLCVAATLSLHTAGASSQAPVRDANLVVTSGDTGGRASTATVPTGAKVILVGGIKRG